jgi:hypothetical protein
LTALLIGTAMSALALPDRAAGAAAAAPSSGITLTSPEPVAPTRRPGPRLLTPGELRDGSTAPGEIGPEHRITPQLRIPLGKPRGAEATAPRPPMTPDADVQTDGLDDAALARCDHLVGEQVRVRCRDRVSRRTRLP